MIVVLIVHFIIFGVLNEWEYLFCTYTGISVYLSPLLLLSCV